MIEPFIQATESFFSGTFNYNLDAQASKFVENRM